MKFRKVTFEHYREANKDNVKNVKNLIKEYNDIKLPQRATQLSAGYDFYAPFTFELNAGETIKIPTGIKALLDEDKFLAIYPRSSLGFKYRTQLDNTVGIIDADYIYAKNGGHIFIKITNDSKENAKLHINKGEVFAQGIIQQYFITEDDNVTNIRQGGIGSTTQNSKN